MTTIAADLTLGVMACDSCWTDDSQKGKTRKVFRVRGELIGFAGDTKACDTALAWFKKGKPHPPPRGDVAALILNGKVTTWEPENGFMDQGKQFAIGSGGPEARAAMMAGADPGKAVWIACQIDARSGGPVRKYRLK